MTNNDEELKESIKDIISKVARIDKNLIKDDASLRKDLWIDSLQAIQIIALIENTYNIKIDEIEIFNVDNIMDVVNIIKEYSIK
jgi:acyl carrier protein